MVEVGLEPPIVLDDDQEAREDAREGGGGCFGRSWMIPGLRRGSCRKGYLTPRLSSPTLARWGIERWILLLRLRIRRRN
ncbi:hypothetical protein LIER_42822 [Lithospermum erythrorhizon]|uniref:Uncharacterized protein n=1 Tax=Lithospermum erythrorhizon TaxID=34254 RepID=A0AAV3NZ53_LITER